MNNLIYMNGEFVKESDAKVSILDHGFLYGDGVFEGIRAYNGSVFRLNEHVDRLYDSANAIMLNIPLFKYEMRDAILETLNKNKLKDAYIRVLVSRGVGTLGIDPSSCSTPNIFIIAQELKPLYDDVIISRGGLKAITSAIRRNAIDALPPNIKSLNYLNNILAKIEANEKGADEAIMLDSNGYVSEGSVDNIFIVKNKKIYTPKALNNLRGITRDVVIKAAEDLCFNVIKTNIGLYDLYTADEMFLTGTAIEIVPIVSIDGRIVGRGDVGFITRTLMIKFKEMVINETS